ncbi:23702_t:CDS:1, partial [Cetraspora pellucida]
ASDIFSFQKSISLATVILENNVESKEIIKNSINLIWKATEGKVVTVTFNSQLRLATISLDNTTLIWKHQERSLLKKTFLAR